jgi:hypothetical protein
VAGGALVAQSALAESVRDRFFSGGPTDVLRVLGDVDARLAEIETRASTDSHSCLDSSALPVEFPLFGEAVTLDLQCADAMTGGGILLFGKSGSTWSFYVNVGAGPLAARATDLGGGKYSVEVWGGVGRGNAPNWDSGSYAGFHLRSNSQVGSFEMTAGGVGVGFCGVTVKGDGTSVYAYGSADGMGGACVAIASSCASASDLAAPGSCAAIDESTFELTGLGRTPANGSNTGNAPALWDASAYPAAGPTLYLDGSSNDMLDFGVSSAADVPYLPAF